MHLFQVGTGSGGIVVLDLLSRESIVEKITLVEPDVFLAHNVHRHLFPKDQVGRDKVELAAQWIRERRSDVEIVPLAIDLTDSSQQARIEEAIQSCNLGVCAVDNEPAKYHFDLLMRKHHKPWTLGEVLSGGIGGWVHRFLPGEACYGCVASHLQRQIQTDNTSPPDYADPQATIQAITVPASRAAIHAIASLHATITLDMLKEPSLDPGFTSLLWTLKKVEGVFREAFQSYRFRIPRLPDCLICRTPSSEEPSGEALDAELAKALSRLAGE
jgi:molybdopterin/thiamine biosynthesis adenylyltransferase